MKIQSTISSFRAYFMFALTATFTLLTPALAQKPIPGPTISVVEYNEDGDKINTFEMKGAEPNKPLIILQNGRPSLNINRSSLQEKKLLEILDANFGFTEKCTYPYEEAFLSELKRGLLVKFEFAKYLKEKKITPETTDVCFARELQKLLSAHKCISKKGLIEFVVQPVQVADFYYKVKPNDSRRIVGASVSGCPFEDPNEVLNECAFVRQPNDGNKFLRAGVWSDFVKSCSTKFNEAPIRKMADSLMQTVHSR